MRDKGKKNLEILGTGAVLWRIKMRIICGIFEGAEDGGAGA